MFDKIINKIESEIGIDLDGDGDIGKDGSGKKHNKPHGKKPHGKKPHGKKGKKKKHGRKRGIDGESCSGSEYTDSEGEGEE